MPRWTLKASQFLLIATLMVSMGGHLALVQTIAWGNMLMTFSSKASLTEAVEKTFDGQHPCPLCKAVTKSKKDEDKKPLLKAEMKMEVPLPAPLDVPLPEFTAWEIRITDHSAAFAEIYPSVPKPPPRVA